MPEIRPRRSMLYMPGSNARAIEKARSIDADAIILDLEDAVAPEAKVEARGRIVASLEAGGFGPREMAVRINGLDTPWGADDLAAVVKAKPAAILLPKVQSRAEILRASEAMTRAGAGADMQLWGMMETPVAILKAAEIAAAGAADGSRLKLLLMGTNDLIKDTRAEMTADRTAAMYWLQACLTAARAYGLDVLDGVYNNFKDAEGYKRECVHGRALGFDGKTLIHPDQV
ncbi:MAG TPA: CoA ester lyase, partial [Hyphomicrobiaceae bacterium]|nr:CoA ester lyase [Hyphomicrobiaceae bacterium]